MDSENVLDFFSFLSAEQMDFAKSEYERLKKCDAAVLIDERREIEASLTKLLKDASRIENTIFEICDEYNVFVDRVVSENANFEKSFLGGNIMWATVDGEVDRKHKLRLYYEHMDKCASFIEKNIVFAAAAESILSEILTISGRRYELGTKKRLLSFVIGEENSDFSLAEFEEDIIQKNEKIALLLRVIEGNSEVLGKFASMCELAVDAKGKGAAMLPQEILNVTRILSRALAKIQ